MSATEFIGAVSLWTGAFVGALRMMDWVLSTKQKDRLAAWSMLAWVWLDDQRVGRFILAVKSRPTQKVVSFLAHLLILSMVFAFLGKTYLGWNIDASLMIGNPRLYAWQAWIDVTAVLISMIFVTVVVHPKIAIWMSSSVSVACFFGRALLAWGVGLFLSVIYVILIGWIMPDIDIMSPSPDTYQNRFEAAFGGRTKVIVVHALTSVTMAPIFTELLILQFIWALSLYWLILIWLAIGIHALLKFVALRIAEHKDGPVLGLSALLVAIGAITSALGG